MHNPNRTKSKLKLSILFNWFYSLRSFKKLSIFNMFIHGDTWILIFFDLCFIFVLWFYFNFSRPKSIFIMMMMAAWCRKDTHTHKKRDQRRSKKKHIVKLIIFCFEYLLFLFCIFVSFHWIRPTMVHTHRPNSKFYDNINYDNFGLSFWRLFHSSKMFIEKYDLFILIKRTALDIYMAEVRRE